MNGLYCCLTNRKRNQGNLMNIGLESKMFSELSRFFTFLHRYFKFNERRSVAALLLSI